MHLRITAGDLAAATAWVSHALPTHPVNAVLHGVLLHADSDTGLLHLSAFNHDTSAATTIAATVNTSGRVLVSGALLHTIAKLLPTGPVTMALHGSSLTLTAGQAHLSLPTLPIEDYPPLPTPPTYIGEVNATEFDRAVRDVAVAACTDTGSSTLFGVLVEISRDTALRLVATDRWRLAVRDLPWQPTLDAPAQPVTVRVDSRDLVGICKHLATPGGTIRLATSPDGRLFGLSDTTRHATVSTFDGQFPDYRQSTPTPSGGEPAATVATAELVSAVKRAAVFTERDNQIRLDFTPDTVEVSGGQHDCGHGREPVPTEFDGQPVGIAFNAQYLLDAVPMFVYPADDTPGGDISRHLVMPMRPPTDAITHPHDRTAVHATPSTV
jgi:DNA polymerase III subunit beta